MNTLMRLLLIVCLVPRSLSETEEKFGDATNVENFATATDTDALTVQDVLDADEHDSAEELEQLGEGEASETEYKTIADEGRSIAHNYEVKDDIEEDQHAAFKKRAKPLKNIFMGIYKNYKSTYLGNKTSQEYKKTLRDRLAAKTAEHASIEPTEASATSEDNPTTTSEDKNSNKETAAALEDVEEIDVAAQVDLTEQHDTSAAVQEYAEPLLSTAAAKKPLTQSLTKKRRKRKHNTKKANARPSAKVSPPAGGDDPLVYAANNEYRYNVGPGLNLSLDMSNEIVHVKLDGLALRELIAGRWLSDNTEQGRGKKYDMMTKVLPLFILPFLIQSAIIPFLVTKLKLLLMKSILVGKLAIFLLIISAFKNSNKMMQTYEVAPSYWAGEPSRRSELAAAASSAPYSGYRVEGKPAAWIN